MRLPIALACSIFLLFSCPPPQPKPDSGTNGLAPIVTSVSPTNGPVIGGTLVTVNGSNFADGAKVKFGDVFGDQVSVVSRARLTVRSPGVVFAGLVAVTVTNTDGQSGTLAGAFTFDAVQQHTITEALLMNPDMTDTSGGATVNLAVMAYVQVPGVTNGMGQGAGVRAQVGFTDHVSTPPTDSDFAWVDAAYLGDVDGPTTGDLARDSYRGNVTVPGATTASKLYLIAARFSVDNGSTWTIADRDGAANGVTEAQLTKFTVALSSVDWCKLGGETVQAPPVISLRGTAAGPLVYGQVYRVNVTTLVGAGASILGQLGYGAAGTDPATWTWVDAGYNRDTGGGSNDEYQAVLPNPGTGTFKFAYRFSNQSGPWAYCDADGLATGGFTETQAGTLTVTTPGVDSCNLQFPTALDTREGRDAGVVFGRVFAQGITDGAAQSTGIEGALGYGPPADPPSAASWQWANATYNLKVPNGGEEYLASFLGPAPGSYVYGYRFRYQAGAWAYCDLDGNANGFTSADAGQLTARAFDIDSCVLDTASASPNVTPSAITPAVLARVTVATLTEAAGQGAGVTAELGYGPVGTAPSGWTTWTAATYDSDQGAADQYRATISAPATLGAYELAYRFKLGANAYAYCDKDGSTNGYTSTQGGRLTVAPYFIQSCRLAGVVNAGGTATGTATSGEPLRGYVRVLVPGMSADAGVTPGLRAQIGVGTQGVNASTSPDWGWKEAPFSADIAVSGEDELATGFTPAYTGTRAVAGRASLDDGGTWMYCDTAGGAFNPANQWAILVSANTDFTWCNTQYPPAADAGALIFGRAFKSGVTPNPDAGLVAELGIGKEVEDPGMAWQWQRGAFNATPGDNSNEYMHALNTDAGAIGLRYAWRYTLDGGQYCYGDLNASGDGFSGTFNSNPNLGVIVP